jgi:hypothetical protein
LLSRSPDNIRVSADEINAEDSILTSLSSYCTAAKEALDFLDKIVKSVAPAPPSTAAKDADTKPSSSSRLTSSKEEEAYIFLSMEAGHFHLLEAGAAGERYAHTKEASDRDLQMKHLEETKDTMDKCGKMLDGFDSVESGVSASYYRVCGDYHKVS